MFSVPEWLLTLGSPEGGHWPVSPGQPWWHSVNIETRHNVATNNKQGQVPPPPPLTNTNIHSRDLKGQAPFSLTTAACYGCCTPG